jgi:hypothetical protein
MSARQRLPNRRASEQFTFRCNGLDYIATISFFHDGQLAEIFLNNAKAGSHSDSSARDSAVVCSLALQHGVTVQTIKNALLRDSQGQASSPLGEALDRISNMQSRIVAPGSVIGNGATNGDTTKNNKTQRVPDRYVVIMCNRRGLHGNGKTYAVVGPFSTAQEAEDWADSWTTIRLPTCKPSATDAVQHRQHALDAQPNKYTQLRSDNAAKSDADAFYREPSTCVPNTRAHQAQGGPR